MDDNLDHQFEASEGTSDEESIKMIDGIYYYRCEDCHIFKTQNELFSGHWHNRLHDDIFLCLICYHIFQNMLWNLY